MEIKNFIENCQINKIEGRIVKQSVDGGSSLGRREKSFLFTENYLQNGFERSSNDMYK